MQTQTVVELKGVSKRANDQTVIDNLSLDIYKGECFGLLGPNGAGKTSTMRMLYGSSPIPEGECYVLGLNVKKSVRQVKAAIGVVPQEDVLDLDFTVRDNLSLFAGYYALDKKVADERVEELLRLLRLEEFENNLAHELSGGYKRRLSIARGMINRPEVIFLDEPTTGLDPQARTWIWNFLKKVKKDLGTVVLTTHYMEEAEQLCDRVAIMDRGRILAVDTPECLVKRIIGNQVVEFEVSAQDIGYYLNKIEKASLTYQVLEDHIHLHLKDNQDARQVLDLIHGPKIVVRNPTLNDVFLHLTGQELRQEAI